MSGLLLRRVPERVVASLFANPSAIEAVLFPSAMETALDQDVEIWLGNRYPVLAQVQFGQAQPPVQALESAGTAIGDIPIGGVPARGFTSAEVRRLAGKLAPIIEADLVKGLATIPLPPTAPSLKELWQTFVQLREFVVETARAEAAMIVFRESS